MGTEASGTGGGNRSFDQPATMAAVLRPPGDVARGSRLALPRRRDDRRALAHPAAPEPIRRLRPLEQRRGLLRLRALRDPAAQAAAGLGDAALRPRGDRDRDESRLLRARPERLLHLLVPLDLRL